MPSNAVQRRMDATRSTFDGLPQKLSEWNDEDFQVVLDRMSAAASLGRTDRWKIACDSAQHLLDTCPGELTRQYIEWAILQGHIDMAHACD